jgi:uncharacterized protein (DUF983 family)
LGKLNAPKKNVSPIRSSLLLRCPCCGKGKVLSGLLTVRKKCAECKLDLSQFNTDDGPAYTAMFIISAITIPLLLWLELSYSPVWWVHLAIWIPFVLLGSLICLIFSKSLFIALQYLIKLREKI